MIRLAIVMIGMLLLITGCASTGNVPESGTAFQLSGCTPFLNCVSSESDRGLYQVEPIQLTRPLDQDSWSQIRTTALALPGASLNEARFGYLDFTCYSDVFHFPDFVELLIDPDRTTLAVRSQSMLGLYDFGVNRHRIEILREQLAAQGLAVSASKP